MVSLSRFTHKYDLGDVVALYHSLRMKPIYLKKEIFESLKAWLESPQSNCLDNTPKNLKEQVEELIKYKILTTKENEDSIVLNYVKSKIPIPAINVCYMIMSEQCNLSCKYCFLGNNDDEKRSNFSSENMSIETADKSIDFFIKQIKYSNLDIDENKPVLIFYGGEPLINFKVLEYIATKINKLKNSEPYIKNLEMSIVTNGLLLDKSKLMKLKELGISIAISVDGFTEKANSMRVLSNNKPVFPHILKALNICKELDIDISLSVTLSEETIKNKNDILKLIDEYNIKGFGFNIMMSSDTFILPKSYNEDAAQFIIDAFIDLRYKGIYEDRIMRKLNSFVESKIYFSDCAATSGGQIVISPSGQVGICHACLHNKKYFVTDIYDENFIACSNKTFIEWSQITPINNDDCLDCEALGICGGGCPINAMYLKPENTIYSIDERFCSHAKKSLNFFINDLYRIIKETK